MAKRYIPELRMSVLDVPEEQSQTILDSLQRTGLYEYVERDYSLGAADQPLVNAIKIGELKSGDRSQEKTLRPSGGFGIFRCGWRGFADLSPCVSATQ